MSGLSRIGSLKDTTAAGYARIVLARNLQLISTILDPKNRSCWAFSLANDASTHFSKSYFDNRIRVHINGKLHNFHVIGLHPIDLQWLASSVDRDNANRLFHIDVETVDDEFMRQIFSGIKESNMSLEETSRYKRLSDFGRGKLVVCQK